jgi:hypothetical protein
MHRVRFVVDVRVMLTKRRPQPLRRISRGRVQAVLGIDMRSQGCRIFPALFRWCVLHTEKLGLVFATESALAYILTYLDLLEHNPPRYRTLQLCLILVLTIPNPSLTPVAHYHLSRRIPPLLELYPQTTRPIMILSHSPSLVHSAQYLLPPPKHKSSSSSMELSRWHSARKVGRSGSLSVSVLSLAIVTVYLNIQRLVTFVVLVVIIAIVVVIAVFQDQIVLALTPAAEWVKRTPAGFLIPIALLVILSVPPVSFNQSIIRIMLTQLCNKLFGAEIIHLLCGFIYGFGVGFAVVCGTFILLSLD